MKIRVKSPIVSKMNLTDFIYSDASLCNDLDRDEYLTRQYIEATQIITNLHDHLVDIDDGSQAAANYASHSTIESRPSNNEQIQHLQSAAAGGTDNDSPGADLFILINDLTKRLRAQLDDYSVNQRFLTGSTDRLSAAIDTMGEGIDEIDQILMPVIYDDCD